MKSSIRAAIGVLLAVFAAHAFAAGFHVVRTGEGAPHEIRTGSTDQVRVIVEFVPARGGARSQQTSAEGAGELARDLRAIHRKLVDAARATDGQPFEPTVRHVYSRVLQGSSATVLRSAMPAIRALPYVARVSLDQPVRALSTDYLEMIKARQAWEVSGNRGRGTVIAIIDSGVDYRHGALGGAFGAGQKVAGGWDFVDDDADPMDLNGHGTHVAGIAAGNGVATDGTVILGVAPEATLVAYRVLDRNGYGQRSDVLAGVERAVDPNQDGDTSDHATVINLSLGGPGDADDPLARAVDSATAAGVIVCAAAGNTGGIATIGSPAAARSIITVGSSFAIGPRLDAWRSSSQGPILETGQIKPEVVAPGIEIVSSYLDGGTNKLSGTSMAAPQVAGLAAILASLHGQWTPEQIKRAIVSAANPILRAIVTHAGSGQIDASRAAAAGVLPEPATLSLGMITRGAFSSSASLRITNRGARRETFEHVPFTGPDVSEKPASVNPSSFVLDPGESIDVTVTVAAPQSAPEDGPVYCGLLKFDGTSTLVVPWLAIRGAALKVKYEPETGYIVRLFDEQGLVVERDAFDQAISILAVPKPYDIVSFDDRDRLIVKENTVLPEGRTELQLSAADAPHPIAIAGNDPFGNRLVDNQTCAQHFTLIRTESPVDRLIMDIMPPHGLPRALRSSAFSTNYNLTASIGCIDADRDTAFVATFDPAIGMNDAITRTPPLWHKRLLQFHMPPGKRGRADVLWSLRIRPELFEGNPDERICVDLGNGLCRAPVFEEFEGVHFITMYLARGASPDVDYEPVSELLQKMCDLPNCFGSYSWGARLSVVDGRVVAIPSWLNVATWQRAIPFQAGAHVPIGDGLIHPVISMERHDAQLIVVPKWRGSAFDNRYPQSYSDDTTLVGPDGVAVPPLSVYKAERQYDLSQPQPGVYRLTNVNRDYDVGNVKGVARINVAFDPAREQVAPPEVTKLFLRDREGALIARPTSGRPFEIVFAVAQYIKDPWLRYAPVQDGATKLWFKPRGSMAWVEASLVNGGPPPPAPDLPPWYVDELAAGVEFRGSLDLSAGHYDLKITIEALNGNRAEFVLEPGFEVISPRRRSVRH